MTETVRIHENRLMPKTQKLLKSLIDEGHLEHEEVQSILNVACPFPDSPIVNSRWPSGTGVDTIATHRVQNFNIARPSAVPAGTTWKAHLVMLPTTLKSTTTMVTGEWEEDGKIESPVNSTCSVATFAVIGVADGAEFPEFGTTAWQDALLFSWCPMDDDTAVNAHRIVGMGAELINTSTQLYRGGYAFGYRRPNPRVDLSFFWTQGSFEANLKVARQISSCMMPPRDVDEITNYPNSYQGEATQGIAVINAPNSVDNPLKSVVPSDYFFVMPSQYPMKVGQANSRVPLHDWNVAGAFLTGQASEATWTIKTIVYLEVAPLPTRDDSSLGSIATLLSGMSMPEQQFSPLALYALSHVLCNMPCAFDYRENPFGEWFHKVLSFIKSAAPAVGTALSVLHPGAGLIANAVGNVAGAMHSVTKAKRNKHKAKQAQQQPVVYAKPLPPVPTHQTQHNKSAKQEIISFPSSSNQPLKSHPAAKKAAVQQTTTRRSTTK